MLERLFIRNFEQFDAVEIELGDAVVFIGPNNSGKTSALEALALWEIGLRKWLEKRGDRPAARKRPGVTSNRRDLVSVPVPNANHLWRDLHLRDVERIGGRTRSTWNVLVEIGVAGVATGEPWALSLEFDYANPESFYCRPGSDPGSDGQTRMAIPRAARDVRIGSPT